MNEKSTERVLALMDEINKIPRQSNHLDKIHPWLMRWGMDHGFGVETDAAKNVLFRVPATRGYEKAPTITLQGHMDMVCEKRPGVIHDFQKDPIVSWKDGEWLRARGTSLGADNAIALALFFDLVTDSTAEHPTLEILITADEETGLEGAQKLQKGFLKGSILLNVDSGDEGVFTIGCAGGMDINMTLPVTWAPSDDGYEYRRMSIGGLEGGHSGVEIHLEKANAIVLLARGLREILSMIPHARVGQLQGGTTHNAIPREAATLLAVPFAQLNDLEKAVREFRENVVAENRVMEKNIRVSLKEAEKPKNGLLSSFDSAKIVDVLRLVPHGVRHMSKTVEGVVECSMNFAILRSEKNQVKLLANQRSALMSRGADFSQIMFSLARLCGGTCETGNYYPPWEPRSNSDVLGRCKMIWKNLYDREAVVEITHAGLECGAIGERFPHLDMISFGPTIVQPHSPDERLHIPSVGRVWKFFRELLKSYRD